MVGAAVAVGARAVVEVEVVVAVEAVVAVVVAVAVGLGGYLPAWVVESDANPPPALPLC